MADTKRREQKARAKAREERKCWREVALYGQRTRESAASSTGSFGAQLRPGRYGIRNYTVFAASRIAVIFGLGCWKLAGRAAIISPRDPRIAVPLPAAYWSWFISRKPRQSLSSSRRTGTRPSNGGYRFQNHGRSYGDYMCSLLFCEAMQYYDVEHTRDCMGSIEWSMKWVQRTVPPLLPIPPRRYISQRTSDT